MGYTAYTKLSYIALLTLACVCGGTDLSSNQLLGQGKILTGHKKHLTMINKVTLTQKGYIQVIRNNT